jgi:16S rRNA (adenine1518-N6/adenine1519-N6)-dimethyltransferase
MTRVAAKKSLGQHFLVDQEVLNRIVAAAELTPSDVVLEIGAGNGVLTRRLAQTAGRVIAVELDNRLIASLRQEFADAAHVTIVHGDILELDLSQLLAGVGTVYKVVANIPYYITGPILRHLLEASTPPTLAVLLVQKEVAERICARPGDMSILAVSVQFYASPRLITNVPAGAFHPSPKVDSAVLRLDLHTEPAVPDLPSEFFFRVVRAGFGQKRKQLHNSLASGLVLPKQVINAALVTADLTPTRRAETLSLTEWAALCRALAAQIGYVD